MTEKTKETVTVPRWALEFALEYGDFEDEGPPGEGWKSPQMRQAIDTLEKIIADLAVGP